MEIRIKDDSVEIDGYVNAIERLSKPLNSRIGKFVERIKKAHSNVRLNAMMIFTFCLTITGTVILEAQRQAI